MTKRNNTSLEEAPKKSKTFVNEYDGYTPKQDDKVPVVDMTKITSDEFYNTYIAQRRPVIIEGNLPGFPMDNLRCPEIESTLNSDDLLLVEKINNGGFGSSQERIKMTFEEFISKLKEEGSKYYLTTQYLEDDPDRKCLADDSEEEEEEEGDLFAIDGESFTPPGSPEDSNDEVPIPEAEFSDCGSIDFNDVHDDFDEFDEGGFDGEEENDEDIITTELPGDPLTIQEAERRFQELIQKPLPNSYFNNDLPIKPELFSKLITQQINIWIGSTKFSHGKHNSLDLTNVELDHSKQDLGLGRKMIGEGISSGLHHDHADNLYIPLKGHKRFTIFSPKDASNLYTVGNLNKVYQSGVIDYKNDENAPYWRELRADSAIKTEVSKWRLDNEEDITEHEKNQLIDSLEAEEDLIDDNEAKFKGVKLDPPSFSKIPASLLHLDEISNEHKSVREELQSALETKYPTLMNCNRLIVNLKPGQLFFLPAGWFHEVTSYGDDEDDNHIHIALNYWFAPPDNKESVYSDNYWTEDFERTMKSCEYLKNNRD